MKRKIQIDEVRDENQRVRLPEGRSFGLDGDLPVGEPFAIISEVEGYAEGMDEPIFD